MTDLLLKKAQKLRKNLTDAEQLIWYRLRKRQINGLRFRRQVPFGNFIVDFACFNPKIIIEIDGGQHNEDDRKIYDQRRTDWLMGHGYSVLRFWNDQVLNNMNEVMEEILRNCLLPHPHLPPKGEGIETNGQRGGICTGQPDSGALPQGNR